MRRGWSGGSHDLAVLRFAFFPLGRSHLVRTVVQLNAFKRVHDVCEFVILARLLNFLVANRLGMFVPGITPLEGVVHKGRESLSLSTSDDEMGF